jgi:hypothetical protein
VRVFEFATVLETSFLCLCVLFFSYVITGRKGVDGWIDVSFLDDESYSQVIMMMVVTGTEMAHLVTTIIY